MALSERERRLSAATAEASPPLRVAGLAVVLIAVAGCFRATEHPRSDGSVPSDTSTEVDALRDLLVARDAEVCRRARECAQTDVGPDYGVLDCHPHYADPTPTLEEVARAEIEVDVEQLERCVAMLRAGTGCVQSGPLEDCYAYVRGALPEGAPCEQLDDHCGRDLWCDGAECVCRRARAIGERCVGNDCVDDGACELGEDGEMRCVLRFVAGAPCRTDWQCSADGDGDLECVDGTCAVAEPPRLGGPCEPFEPEPCGPELWCDGLWGERVCRAPVGPGERCYGSNACSDPLVCIDFMCSPGRSAGEACASNGECAAVAPSCVITPPEGSPFRGTCSSSPNGRMCTVAMSVLVRDEPPEDPCPEGYGCIATSDFGLRGVCRPASRFGEPCTDSALCPLGGRCVGGVCARVVASTEPCGPDAACPWTHVCEDGRCTPRPIPGAACDAHPCILSECIEGTCGRRAPGEPCSIGDYCQYGCGMDGRCLPPTREGAPCAFDTGWCGEGLFCNYARPEPICVARVCDV